MIKQNTSTFGVPSRYMASPHAQSGHSPKQSRRRGGSSTNKVIANKYSISNANHTIIDDNYSFSVYKYTVYDDANDTCEKIGQEKGFYGSYTYDNDNYSTFINGKCINDNREKYHNVCSEEKCCQGNDIIKEAEDDEGDSFTFSSVADFMEFSTFSSSACPDDAEAQMLQRRSSMSPADELFQDGKIRPLLQPITSSHHHPICSKPFLYQHASFNEFAAQYLACSNCNVIKQVENPDHPHKLPRHKELNPALSGKIDQESKELCADQLECRSNYAKCEHNHAECELVYADLPSENVSFSAPTYPTKENLANEQTIDLEGTPQDSPMLSTSQGSCCKRCQSLSRIFQTEDSEQVLEVQDLMVEDGITKGRLVLNYKRKTLQDLLSHEVKPKSKSEIMQKPCKMVHEKPILGLTIPKKDIVKSFHDVEGISSSAREKKSLSPPSNVKNGRKIEKLSPHELHYGSQKIQADRSKKTFLPYRPGLLGCIGYPPL